MSKRVLPFPPLRVGSASDWEEFTLAASIGAAPFFTGFGNDGAVRGVGQVRGSLEDTLGGPTVGFWAEPEGVAMGTPAVARPTQFEVPKMGLTN